MSEFFDFLDVGRDTLLAVCAFTLLTTGVAGCILPILPGVIIAYGGVVCAYFYSGDSVVSIGVWSLVIWLGLTLFVTLLDYFLPAYMARAVGAARRVNGALRSALCLVLWVVFLFRYQS